jgi:lipopolysaccharide/colanic/teichoic acid biosynthesis glycosyltransferase
VWKRALDLCLLVLTLPLTAPVALVIAGLIWLTGGRPVIFRQERVGFQLARSDVPMVKLDQKGDTRLIPGARMLRATGLDELPQLLNVLRGEMSLVGPRPCLPYEFDQYTAEQKQRLSAAPGLTGLWQVSGKNNTTFNEMIRLDVEYSRRQSPWLDLTIILRTVPALVIQSMEARNKQHQAAPSTVPQRIT